MRGGSRKTSLRQSGKTQAELVASDKVSFLFSTKEFDAPPTDNLQILTPPTDLQYTPKQSNRQTRRSREPNLTSTPIRKCLTRKLCDAVQYPPPCNHLVPGKTTLKTAESCLPCSRAAQPRCAKEKARTGPKNGCHEAAVPPVKRKCVRKLKTDTNKTQTASAERQRPRFELELPPTTEQDGRNLDESFLSSDLSIELSHHEELLPTFSPMDEEDEDEDEELPSFLMKADKQPLSITEGAFVWCKFRSCPHWPAVVKRVDRRTRKASIVFIDDQMIHTKKGLTVGLRTLKPFNCEEANELMCKAKEKYGVAADWSSDLIADYRIRIACGSFSGSFVEYLAHDMSYPVRKKYPQAASERLTIASDSFLEELSDTEKEDSLSEQQGGVRRRSKRLLPDRTHAAHNRANEKLVHFIVKQRMVEERLLAVMNGQQQSKWLRSFLSGKRRRAINIYLEDDEQLDQVYLYLSELHATAQKTTVRVSELKVMERVSFVLDVLLPEAIIYAIAGVDNVCVKKAEEKYLKGRCISNREREEFDLLLEEHMRPKALKASRH